MDKEKRFWVDTTPIKQPYGEHTLGIVDEQAGGIIAYVGSEYNAILIITIMENSHG